MIKRFQCIFICGLILMAGACSREGLPPNESRLPPPGDVPPPGAENQTPIDPGELPDPLDKAPSLTTSGLAYMEPFIELDENAACNFWNSLPEKGVRNRMKLVHNLHVVEEEIYPKRKPPPLPGGFSLGRNRTEAEIREEVWGNFVPGDVPHLLYKLSRETDNETVRNQLLFPMTVVETKEYVKENYASLHFNQLVSFGWTGFVLKRRNGTVINLVEKLIPGAFTGDPRNVAMTNLMEPLNRFAGVDNFTSQHLGDLRVLEKSVPIFRSPHWRGRERDLREMLLILNREDTDKLSFAEKVCHFAIHHRVMAQLVTLKGILGAPVLLEDGKLSSMPTKNEVNFPTQTKRGLYKERDAAGLWQDLIITEDWIRAELKDLENSTAKPWDALSSEDHIAGLRYLITLISIRSEKVWKVPTENEAYLSRPRIDPILVKMGMGLFAIGVNNVRKDEFPDENIDLVKMRLTLSEDTPEAFTLLVHTILEAYEALLPLRTQQTPTDVNLLSPEELQTILGSGPEDSSSALGQLDQLLTIIGIEMTKRIYEGRGGDELKRAYSRLYHFRNKIEEKMN